jgi:hypothetical protein
MAYAGLRQRAKVYEYATDEVRERLHVNHVEGVDDEWQRMKELISKDAAAAQGDGGGAKDGAGDKGSKAQSEESSDYVDSQPAPPPRPERHKWRQRLIFAIGMLLVIAAGAALILALGQQWSPATRLRALVADVIAVVIATYALASYLMVRIPLGCALVVESHGIPDVLWGPDTHYRWPLGGRVRAWVPTRPIEYTPPRLMVQLNADESVYVRLSLRYAVALGLPPGPAENVTRSISAAAPAAESMASGEPVVASSENEPQTLEGVQDRWEQRLLADLAETLALTLQGRSFTDLSCQSAQQRRELKQLVCHSLSDRLHKWGMTAEEVSTIEVVKP